MTEPTPRTTICPDCSALIPHNGDEMRNHRSFHNDLRAKNDGIRRMLAELDNKISRTLNIANDAQRAAENIVIPEAPAPLEITDATDEWADLPGYQTDDQPISTYADDDPYTPATTSTIISNAGSYLGGTTYGTTGTP